MSFEIFLVSIPDVFIVWPYPIFDPKWSELNYLCILIAVLDSLKQKCNVFLLFLSQWIILDLSRSLLPHQVSPLVGHSRILEDFFFDKLKILKNCLRERTYETMLCDMLALRTFLIMHVIGHYPITPRNVALETTGVWIYNIFIIL